MENTYTKHEEEMLADIRATFPEYLENSNAEITNEFETAQSNSRLGTVGKYLLGGLSVALVVAGAAKDMAPSLDDAIVYHADHVSEDNTQLVPYSGVAQENPVTDGQNIVFEEDGRIVTVDTTDNSIVRSQNQIAGLNNLQINNGSISFQTADGIFAYDGQGFLNTVESGYVGNHHSDSESILREGSNGGVVREDIISGAEQVIYENGSVSNLRVEGDMNMFSVNEVVDNNSLERLMLVDSNDVANATEIHNGPVKFAEMSGDRIYVGVENPFDNETVNIWTYDLNGNFAGPVINSVAPNTFDIDQGTMVAVEGNQVLAYDLNDFQNTQIIADSNATKTDIDIEGKLVTWVENGTQVAYVTIPEETVGNQTNETTLEDLMAELNNTRDQLSAVSDQLNSSEANDTAYQAEVNQLNGQISDLQTEINGLDSNASDYQTEVDRLNGDISGLNELVSALYESNGNSANNTKDMRNQRDENATRVGELEEALEVAEGTSTMSAFVGIALGGAAGGMIGTRLASKPEVDYGSSEEE
ncbi:MAG: hypothetical protein QF460_01150 [Candidatus Nanoarchaeia archaeon]|jgi:archaellum component FlaC|nr:hypothetical protein [Candidatus Nanoarchaeia archaeon]